MPDVAAAERDAGLRRQLEKLGSGEVGGWKVGLTSGRARDSMGKVDRADVIAAIDGACAAFEINEQRLGRGASPGERLADNLNQWGVVVGALSRLDWPRFDFERLVVSMTRDADRLETVHAQGHIDDHFDSIAALVRQLARFGLPLAAGAAVITGSFTRQPVARAGIYRGDFGAPFSPVQVEFQ